MTDALDIYGGKHPWEVPAYTIPVAGNYLGLSPQTLRSWVTGYQYETKRSGRRAQPCVIVPALRRNRHVRLSFVNLIEAHMLMSLRRTHEISLPQVRKVLSYVGSKFGTKHPLFEEKFATDGQNLFVERLGGLLRVDKTGKALLRKGVSEGIDRIEYAGGLAEAFFPWTKRFAEPGSDEKAPKLIRIQPTIAFGRPVVAGTGVPISELLDRWKAGDHIAALSADFGIPKDELEEALSAAA